MKIKLKLLVVLIIILGLMLIFNLNSVNAVEYSENEQKAIITIEDLGLGGTNSVTTEWNDPTENDEGMICNTLSITNVKQDILNNYSNSEKQVNVKVKIQIPNNIIKAEINSEKCNIENINGKKYIEVNEIIKYTNSPFENPVEEDVAWITFGLNCYYDESVNKVELYETETRSNEYNIYNCIFIRSENGDIVSYYYDIVNKYDGKYPFAVEPGGYGGDIHVDKRYYQEYPDTDGTYSYPYAIPQDANLSETFLKLNINVYQGEKIEIDNIGTLYYVGSKKYLNGATDYIYKNSLNNLKQSASIFTAKNESGYILKRYIHSTYELDQNLKEQEVTGNFSSDSKNTKLNVMFNVSGIGNANIDAVQIAKTDILYKRLEKEMVNKICKNEYNPIILDVYDIQVVEGEYKGKLNITFNVGAEHNGKECVVGHLCFGDSEVEDEFSTRYYRQTVENGKVTITVDSLSPFMISLLDKKTSSNEGTIPTSPTSNEEKDETPKTGSIDIIGYVLVATVTAGVGILTLKKKFN